MELLIAAVARAKRVIPSALNSVALHEHAPALALRGIAMVQHGCFLKRDPLSASSGLSHKQALTASGVSQTPCRL
jgi:hypothetical protein